MSKTNTTRCSECGGTVGPFTTYFNASAAETHYVCNRCSAEGSAAQFDDLAELDEHIAKVGRDLVEMEPLLKKSSRSNDLPDGLAQFAHTPMTIYKSMQDYLAALKTRRIELLATTRNPEKLQYELDKLLSEEKYEEVAALKKEIDDLRNRPTKKADLKEKKSKVLLQNTDPTVGKCVSCKTNYPKPPGLFMELEDPKVHQMCLPCIARQTASIARTVKTTDYMIEAMESFAKMSEKLAMLGMMMQMDEDERAKFQSEDDLPKVKSSTQRFHEVFIKNLKEHRAFLVALKEDPKDVQMFIDMQEKFDLMPRDEKDMILMFAKELVEMMNNDKKKSKPSSPQTGKKKKR